MKLIELGREPLAQFYEQPDIPAHLEMYWRAFEDLTTERQIGMAIGPIPRSRVRAYARDELDLGEDAFELFCGVIERMDADFVKRANAPKQQPSDGSPVRSTASPEDGKSVAKILDSVAKKPNRPMKRKPANA